MAKAMSAQNSVTPTAEGLAASVSAVQERGLPPVEKWNPPLSGDLDMRIARDGTWFYLGSPITRPGMVKLFSSILKREGDAFFLVTPVEKWRISVEDAPFVGRLRTPLLHYASRAADLVAVFSPHFSIARTWPMCDG